MLTIGLFPNIKKQDIEKVLLEVIRYLQSRQIKVVLPATAAIATGYSELAISEQDGYNQLDVAITLGGDGTLLSTARQLATACVPICSVNLGRLGFLTSVELVDIEDALDKIIAGEFTIEERLMLDALIVRNQTTLQVSTALNEVVIAKNGLSRVTRMNLYIGNELTANYPADGLIISTSTGSTGYSLSAGGPIIHPELKVIVITPICPHTLNARSLVVSEKDEVKVVMEAAYEELLLTVDGQTVFNLLPNDIVLVRKSNLSTKLVRLDNNRYYQVLRRKLWWSVGDDSL